MLPMSPLRSPLLSLVTVLALAACASPPPAPSEPASEVQRRWGPPTATYALPGGGQRLEYATGPYGRTTWMVDVDTAGRVTQARQVLSEAEFFAVQSERSLSGDELLRRIGTPGERRGARGGGQTWSWRYPTNDCLWFQASIGRSGQLEGSAMAIDPRCDAPSDARQ